MLSIYTINLDERSDRWQQACANYQAHGLSPDAVRRWSAVADKRFGALGCAKSHVTALTHFLTHDDRPYALVLEDDFDFVRPFADCVQTFGQLQQGGVDWDVLLLMGTQVLAGAPMAGGVARVIEAQSAAAYLFSRRYAAQLLACFAPSLPQMEALAAPGLRDFAVSRLAIDQAWKPLQRRDRWLICHPAMGRQRPSFSDIEGRHVDYDSQTYALGVPAAAPAMVE